jgi:glucose-6-phosphate 1-dehydrogenase
MRGDPTLFTREDAVLESWRIIDPLLGISSKVYAYEPGSEGPTEAGDCGSRLLDTLRHTADT